MIWRPFFRWPGGMLAKTLCCLIVSLAAPVVARSPTGPPQTLAFDDTVGAGNPDVTDLEVGAWLFASQEFHTVSLSDAGLCAKRHTAHRQRPSAHTLAGHP